MSASPVVQPVRREAVVVGLSVAGIAAVTLVSWIVERDLSDQATGRDLALVTSCLVAIVVALTGTWRYRSTWVAAFGLALIAIGSGIGRRWAGEWTHSENLDIVWSLDIWWILIGEGATIALGAFLWSIQASSERVNRMLASGSLLAVGAGYALIAVTADARVIGRWA